MYVSLYRRYRPQTFSDMVGQSAAVAVLLGSLKEGRIGHAYLFSGPRGCGKTSAARIIAKSLICEHSTDFEPCGECESCRAVSNGEHLDVIEIDGASNRGIGEIRDLKTRVNLKPLSAKYKIYIIDEVHMLTEQAFNALLKTLEEPPANVVFLLATTEPNKVPVTIRSRCQHIPFHRISMSDIVKRIEFVCKEEQIACENEAVWEVARAADGAMRDALSLTEQAVAMGNGALTMPSVKALLGGSSRAELEQFVTYARSSASRAAAKFKEITDKGASTESFTSSLFTVFRDLWFYSLWGEDSMEAIEISEAEKKFICEESRFWSKEQLRNACSLCGSLLPKTKYGMKQEVFSGMLMLGIAKVLGGVPGAAKQQTAAQPAEAVVPTSVQQLADSRSQPRKDELVRPADKATIPEPAKPQVKTEQSAPEEKTEIPSVDPRIAGKPVRDANSANGSGFAAKENALADLLAHIPSKKLQFAAALLNATIVKTDNGEWDIEFEKDCLAKGFFKIPANKRILGEAVVSLWGVKSRCEEPEPDAAADAEPAPVAPAARPAAKPRTENSPTAKPQAAAPSSSGAPSSAGLDRMLKLIGADVLYVDEAESYDTVESDDKN